MLIHAQAEKSGICTYLAKFYNKGIASVWELLCSCGRDSCTQGPRLFVRVLPSQLRASCRLEGNSSSVGGGTQFQGARAAHAIAFVSITQHRVSDREITVI